MKLQISNSNLQTSSKHQKIKRSSVVLFFDDFRIGIWNLNLVWDLELGVWSLINLAAALPR
jgi:hypothetical protein